MAEKKQPKESALKVQEGIQQPDAINHDLAGKLRQARARHKSPEDLIASILAGDRVSLGRAITLIESTRSDDQELSRAVINGCLPHAGKSVRIGITGVPGVGKSTFIESFGRMLTSKGHRVAVLAIDPSSQRSKGSILGDKTRMDELATDPQAFIRPSSSSGTLGGVTRNTRESITLCEAAGFDIIIVETVGVGQSETAVHSMVDFFLLLMLPGAGDELQGIKRGIMEMADGLVINKADGANIEKAKVARAQLENALHYFPPNTSGWTPLVTMASSTERTGLEEVWDMITGYSDQMRASGYFEQKRKEQLVQILRESIESYLVSDFYANMDIAQRLNNLKQEVMQGKISPYQLAHELVTAYLKKS